MCGFFGSWGNPKTFYCKKISKPVKSLKCLGKMNKFFKKNFGLPYFPLLQKYKKESVMFGKCKTP